MGGCSSMNSRSGSSTSKLILQNGQLQEFSVPVKISHLLLKNPSSFICNSDDMDYDDVVLAIDKDQFLQPGHLYFVLPLNRLKRPLTAAEMAALAVKANMALAGKHGLKVVESDLNEMKTGKKIGGRGGLKKGNVGGRRRRSTVAMLSAIPE